MKKFFILFASLLLFIPILAESQQPLTLIEVSPDGEAKVTQILAAKSIISSISIPLISDKISNVLATDERGILLKNTQNGDSLGIATLGATGVTLTYKVDITSFNAGVWNVAYHAETDTIVALPQLSNVVSVSSIPIDIEDNTLVMPKGDVSITFTISEVSSKTFFVLEGGQNYPVEIISAAKISDFFKESNEIRFRTSDTSTILFIVPSIVIPNPIGASLNGDEVDFNPYYNNGTHNWIRIDPHESGTIKIGGDVRASQVLSKNPGINAPEDNNSIYLTIGIILGVLAVGYVVFSKYIKIGLVRTNGSKGSNRPNKLSKHHKKNVKSRQLGILALTVSILLLTIPSASAQVTDSNPAIENSSSQANAAYRLMELITDAESEASALGELITSNGLNMGKGLTEYADALSQAKMLAETDPAAAAALLQDAEGIMDDIYTQLEAQIDSRQNERFTDFVERATDSIQFILLNVEVSDAVKSELETTLAILQSGDTEAILDATSETSDIGLTASMFPDDHPGFGKASEQGKENGQGKGLGLGDADNLPPGLQKLPPGIKAKYGIPTDSDLSTVSFDENSNDNGETNDETNGETNGEPPLNFFSLLPGFGAALDNNGNGPSEKALENGQGVGLGVGPNAPGIAKKSDEWIIDHGFIMDDDWSDDYEGDDFSTPYDNGQGKGQGKHNDKGKNCAHGACAGGQGTGGQGTGGQGTGGQGTGGQGTGGSSGGNSGGGSSGGNSGGGSSGGNSGGGKNK